jgi:hypothetical protein
LEKKRASPSVKVRRLARPLFDAQKLSLFFDGQKLSLFDRFDDFAV